MNDFDIALEAENIIITHNREFQVVPESVLPKIMEMIITVETTYNNIALIAYI
jgi:hypothetical protein